MILHLLICTRPPGLALQIKNSVIARTARGRCGHDIATRHTLLAGPSGPMIHDSMAMMESGRNTHRARPLGLLGFLTGRSIHRCDVCRRKDELQHSVVCITCGCSIAPGASVEIVPSALAQAASHERWRHLATTTKDNASTVVCAGCAMGQFEHHTVSLRWAGLGVMHERDYSALFNIALRRAA